MKEESLKTGLKFNIQKTKIIVSGPITSWQINGKKIEIVTDFIFFHSKITMENDCSPKIKTKHTHKQTLLFGRKAMTKQDITLKTLDITFPSKVHIVKAMVF